MSDHKHHMVHGWVAKHPKLDWICTECLKAWIPLGRTKGIWKMIDFKPEDD